MGRKLVLALVLFVFGFAAVASADNIRPQPLGSSGETQLQTMLNSIFNPIAAPNAVTDQQAASMWLLPGVAPNQSTGPSLDFEAAGNAGSNSFGIWSYDANGTISAPDGKTITAVTIFDGSAVAGISHATLSWDDPTTLRIDAPSGAGATGVNDGVFSGIYRYGFGFFLAGPGTTGGLDQKFWSLDAYNPKTTDGGTYPGGTAFPAYPNGTPQMFAYLGTNGRWVFAFEDVAIGNGADGDHNDLVASAESIVPVPEPGSMVLLGSGLFGLAAAIRRRVRK